MKNNIAKIMAAVQKSDLDAIFISSRENKYYACGFRLSDGDIIVTGNTAALFTDSRYYEEACILAPEEITVMKSETGGEYYRQLKSFFKENNINTLGVEEKKITLAVYEDIKDGLGINVKPGQALLEKLRSIKSREELEIMIKAQRIAEKSFNELVSMIKMSMTEKDLAAELLCRFIQNGAEDRSFNTIAVTGAHSSVPHGQPDDRKLVPGFLTIDFGCKFDGYCSDTTRTLCIGEPTKEMEKVYNTVLQAQLAGIRAAKAGIPGKELDGAARRVIEEAGYGEYFTHSLGHGLGLEVHEAPRASKISTDIIEAGVVISCEPGIYIPGKYGVRIEDVLYITKDGCENITDLPKELTVICA